MESVGIASIIIILITIVTSYRGFKDYALIKAYAFDVDGILVRKEYNRIISSGFLHTGVWHLGFNMITLYLFGDNIENTLGIFPFLLIYFLSLIGGSLFSLYIHRNHGDYTAVGASGAVSGIIFAAIALIPSMKLGLLFLPSELSLPAWAFGLVYVIYTIFGIKTGHGNIGHAAHLGGGIVGMIVALIFQPSAIATNAFPILCILIPSVVFLFLLFVKPALLLVDHPFNKTKGYQTIEDKYYEKKRAKEYELDDLLDKINRSGINSLSKEEKDRLDELSN